MLVVLTHPKLRQAHPHLVEGRTMNMLRPCHRHQTPPAQERSHQPLPPLPNVLNAITLEPTMQAMMQAITTLKTMALQSGSASSRTRIPSHSSQRRVRPRARPGSQGPRNHPRRLNQRQPSHHSRWESVEAHGITKQPVSSFSSPISAPALLTVSTSLSQMWDDEYQRCVGPVDAV